MGAYPAEHCASIGGGAVSVSGGFGTLDFPVCVTTEAVNQRRKNNNTSNVTPWSVMAVQGLQPEACKYYFSSHTMRYTVIN